MARLILAQANRWRKQALREINTRFVFPSDELYQIAETDLPPYDEYEDFSQIENGVGLLARFEWEFLHAAQLDPDGDVKSRHVAVATGVSAAAWLRSLIQRQPICGVQVTVYAIVNRFWGETITVAGLVTGADLLDQLAGLQADELLIPSSMLRAGEAVFLDGLPLSQVEGKLGVPVRAVPPDGAELLFALRGTEQK